MEFQSLTTFSCVITVVGLLVGHFLIEAVTKEKLSTGDLLADLFSPRGAISRHRYWLATWVTYGFHASLSIAALENSANMTVLYTVFAGSIIMTIPIFLLVAKRFRAIGKRGLWAASLLVLPIAPIIILLVGIWGNRQSNNEQMA